MMANKFDKDERETVRDNLNQEWQCYIHEFSYQNLDATISTKHQRVHFYKDQRMASLKDLYFSSELKKKSECRKFINYLKFTNTIVR